MGSRSLLSEGGLAEVRKGFLRRCCQLQQPPEKAEPVSQLQPTGFLSSCPVKQRLPDAWGDTGREAAARQTNDTCDRTETVQNNFINSVNISALYIG